MRLRWSPCLVVLLCACASRRSHADPTPPEAEAKANPAQEWSDDDAPPEDAPPDGPPTELAAPTPATEPGTIAWQDVDRVTARGPGWLLRQLAPEPYRPRGRFEGWQITAVFPDAPELCEPTCDLRTGDIIVAVEGKSLETPTAYSALFERAATLQTLRVVRIREGVKETVLYRISPRPLPATRKPG